MGIGGREPHTHIFFQVLDVMLVFKITKGISRHVSNLTVVGEEVWGTLIVAI
jgi:hypothetical protein